MTDTAITLLITFGILVLIGVWTMIIWAKSRSVRGLFHGIGLIVIIIGLYMTGVIRLTMNGIRSLIDWAERTPLNLLVLSGLFTIGAGVLVYLIGSFIKPVPPEEAKRRRVARREAMKTAKQEAKKARKEAEQQEAQTPAAAPAPTATTTGTSSPNASSPNASSPNTSSPNTSSPNTSSPNTSSSSTSAQDTSGPTTPSPASSTPPSGDKPSTPSKQTQADASDEEIEQILKNRGIE